MELMKVLFRDEGETSVDAVQTWEVRWTSRHGSFSADTRPEIRVFTNREDAERFADALRDAFDLINHIHENKVTVSKHRA